MPKQAICLLGPTATGKTALAIALAAKLPIQIISVDSAMIYRGMDIGTGKPSSKEQQLAPHELIDIIDPTSSYSVARFCDDVVACMGSAHKAGKIPLLVGGTMMYFQALYKGLSRLPDSCPKARAALTKQLEQHGVIALHQELSKVDPIVAAKIKTTDKQRILRALEVYKLSGTPLSVLQQQENIVQTTGWQFNNIALFPEDRAKLHTIIAARFAKMLRCGFVAEVEHLIATQKLTAELPAMRSVGYRQVLSYLNGLLSYEDMQAKAIAATRQLAKRQITWLRSFAGLKILNPFMDSSKLLIQVSEMLS